MGVNLNKNGIVLSTGQGINPNLLKAPAKYYNSSSYNSYQFNLSENLVSGTVYTMQLWDVNVAHSGKTSAQLAVNVYWGGGYNSELTWYVPTGHSDYLVSTFTAKIDNSDNGRNEANNLWLNIYNSVPNADGTRSMSIEKWKLEKGSVATPWIPNISDPEYLTCGFYEEKGVFKIGNNWVQASEIYEI